MHSIAAFLHLHSFIPILQGHQQLSPPLPYPLLISLQPRCIPCLCFSPFSVLSPFPSHSLSPLSPAPFQFSPLRFGSVSIQSSSHSPFSVVQLFPILSSALPFPWFQQSAVLAPIDCSVPLSPFPCPFKIWLDLPHFIQPLPFSSSSSFAVNSAARNIYRDFST